MREPRLYIVSNRLPITITKSGSTYSYQMSSGGLVSALSGLKIPFTWMGWPGIQVDNKPEVERELALRNCIPVYLSSSIADAHYNGFSNSILWPLFHYHPGEIDFDEAYWEAYQQANHAFAEAITPLIQEGDLIWVHDYRKFHKLTQTSCCFLKC